MRNERRAPRFSIHHSSFIIPHSSFRARNDAERQPLSAADDFEWRALADTFFGQQLVQLIYSRNRLTGKPNDDVALLQATSQRRTVLVNVDHKYSMLNVQVIEAHDAARQRHVLACDSDVAAADAPIFYQTPGDELRSVNGNRK